MDQFYGWLFDIIIIIIMNEKKTMNQSVEFRIKYVGKKTETRGVPNMELWGNDGSEN